MCINRSDPLVQPPNFVTGRREQKESMRRSKRVHLMETARAATRAVSLCATESPALRRQQNPPQVQKYPFEFETTNTRTQGEYVMRWLLYPIHITNFFDDIFEKKPFLVHNHESKFQSLISLSQIRDMLSCHRLAYGVDLLVARYKEGNSRTFLNVPNGQVAGEEAWVAFEKGATLRLLRPQIQSDAIYRLCAHLEAFVDCVVSSNVFVVPRGCCGFPRHFDDVDSFVCQVSGHKRWRVYAPQKDGLGNLPRQSSRDVSLEEVNRSDIVIDTVLVPGDMLYLPRGAVHEINDVDDDDKCALEQRGDKKNFTESSVHVTICMFQSWTWADLLAEGAAMAVHSAAYNDVRLRRTLPLSFSKFAGVGSVDANQDKREWFHRKAQFMMSRVANHFPTGTATDSLALRFMRQRLEPVIIRHPSDTQVKLHNYNLVRAVCDNAARVVINTDEETLGCARIVTCVRNGRDRRKNDTNGEFANNGLTNQKWTEHYCLPEEGVAINFVLQKYPDAVQISHIPFDGDAMKLVESLVHADIFEIV